MKVKNLLLRVSEWLRRRVTALKSEKGAVKREELREEGMTPKSEEPMESRATLGANRSTSNAETLMMRMEEFIGEHYEVRLNRLSQQYELAEMGKGEWVKLDDELCSRLMMEMNREGIAITKAHLVRAVVQGSGLAQRYHPVCSYLESLPQWDGTGHIEALFRRVTDDEQLLGWLRRWFIGMVAQVMGRMGTYGNSLCPILISRQQGWGKSQFTKMLLPHELRMFYTDTFNLQQEDACLRRMTSYMLINVDEMDRFRDTRMATLKNMVQLSAVSMKRAYRSHMEEKERMASFIATSNRRYLLHDETGSRRFICVELAQPHRHGYTHRPRAAICRGNGGTGRRRALLDGRGGDTSARSTQCRLCGIARCMGPAQRALHDLRTARIGRREAGGTMERYRGV